MGDLMRQVRHQPGLEALRRWADQHGIGSRTVTYRHMDAVGSVDHETGTATQAATVVQLQVLWVDRVQELESMLGGGRAEVDAALLVERHASKAHTVRDTVEYAGDLYGVAWTAHPPGYDGVVMLGLRRQR